MAFKTCPECGVRTLWISWSGLRSFESCKQKAHLKLSGKKATLADQRIFFPGTVTDRVSRDWLAHEPEKNLGAMPGMVESIMEQEFQDIHEKGGKLFWKDRGDKEQVLRDCIEAVTNMEPLFLRDVVPYEYDVDFRFKAPLWLPAPGGGMDLVVINGAMDILVKKPRGFYIRDVKHTRNEHYWQKTKGQLAFYDLALQVMFGEPSVHAALVQPLCKEQAKSLPVDDHQRSQMMQRVLNYATATWTQDHEPTKDREECGMCEVRHACSRFTPIISKDGKKRVSIG